MQLYKACLGALVLLTAAGCASGSKITWRVYEEVGGSLPESHVQIAELPKYHLRIPIDPIPVLTEKDIQAAEIHPTAGGDAVLVRYDIEATMRVEELTTRDRGRYLVVFWNDRPVAAWLVDQRLTNGQFLVEGDFTDEEAAVIVRNLNRLGGKNPHGR